MSQKSSAPPARVPSEKLARDIRRAAHKHHSAQDKTRSVLEGHGSEESIENIEKRGPESFAFLVATAAPVAALPNRLPSPDHLNPLENKAFSGDLEGAQVEYSGVFSPNPRILSKA